MSQRVVTDVGNYIVGVWRVFLRVHVSIPIDKPPKRRMKLKKSEANRCWVDFKYEGIPTFCFICGMVGHSDKLCERLFDTLEDKIEKPLGTWMRAEPRRRTHTMGSKWLRQGGIIPMKSTGEDGGDKFVNPIISDEISHEKSGTLIDGKVEGKTSSAGENNGGTAKQMGSNQSLLPQNQVSKLYKEGKENYVDPNEIIVTDPKRRRMDSAYMPKVTESP